jgi:hypothetical protein
MKIRSWYPRIDEGAAASKMIANLMESRIRHSYRGLGQGPDKDDRILGLGLGQSIALEVFLPTDINVLEELLHRAYDGLQMLATTKRYNKL